MWQQIDHSEAVTVKVRLTIMRSTQDGAVILATTNGIQHGVMDIWWTYPSCFCRRSILRSARSSSCLTFHICVSQMGFLHLKLFCSSTASRTDCSNVRDLPMLWKVQHKQLTVNTGINQSRENYGGAEEL